MEQAGRAPRRRRSAAAFPSVEADMVVIPAGRNEGRFRAVTLHQFEAEHAAIEAERAIEIGDLQVHMADPDAGLDRRGSQRRGVRTAISHWRALPPTRS